MCPHLERQDNEGNWVELDGTKHNYDPKSKSKKAQMVHGIMVDTDGVREIADSAGQVCNAGKPKRKYNTYEYKYYSPIGTV